MNEILATRWQRFVAALIDSFPVVAVALLFKENLLSPSLRPVAIVLQVAYIGLQCYFLANSGQTIGKKIMHIRIVGITSGENGGFMPNVLKRWFLNALLSLIPLYALVDVLFIFREDQRCVHDLIAGTRVVRGDKPAVSENSSDVVAT